MSGPRPQEVDDLGQPIPWGIRQRSHRRGRRCGHHPAVEFDQGVGDLRHRQHQIDRTGGDRAPRHAVEAGLVGVLGDDQAAFFLHRLQPDAAVGPGPGQDHADGAGAAIRRQRVQQKIERQPCPVTRFGLRQVQGAVADGEIGGGRDDIEVVGRDGHSIGCLEHGHRRVAGQQVHHHAFMGRIEMLDDDESHAAGGGQRRQEFPAGVEATRRGADPDYRELA